jgi:hypothetical protein
VVISKINVDNPELTAQFKGSIPALLYFKMEKL